MHGREVLHRPAAGRPRPRVRPGPWGTGAGRRGRHRRPAAIGWSFAPVTAGAGVDRTPPSGRSGRRTPSCRAQYHSPPTAGPRLRRAPTRRIRPARDL